MQLAIAVGIFLAGVAGGIRWHAGQDAIAAQELAKSEAHERHIKAEKINTAAEKLEKAKETVRTEFVEVEKVVEKLVNEPFYVSGQCLDETGLKLLNDAVLGNPSESHLQPIVRP